MCDEDSSLFEYVKNKKILLLGPSDEVDEEILNNVDDYDRVVSINSSFDLFEHDFHIFYIDGDRSRRDAIANKIRNQKIKNTFAVSFGWSHGDFLGIANYENIQDEPWQESDGDDVKISNGPTSIGGLNTGYVALLHLLRQNIKSLTFTGMNFHRSGYGENYKCITSGGNVHLKTRSDVLSAFSHGSNRHDPDKQFMHFKEKIYGVDDRVFVDKYMKEYLADIRYEKMECK